jgi:hypothetical protein
MSPGASDLPWYPPIPSNGEVDFDPKYGALHMRLVFERKTKCLLVAHIAGNPPRTARYAMKQLVD